MRRFTGTSNGVAYTTGGFAVLLFLLSMWVGTLPAAEKKQVEKPRYGGILVHAIRGAPPSWDAHQETTTNLIHPASAFYSLLCKFDPQNYPKVVGDLAEKWTLSKDSKIYTFKIRKGVQFHDGTPLTARDVKASYDHIIFPPAGVISPRRPLYASVDKIEAPDSTTVVFTLKYPSASFLLSVASPYNWIYKADNLEKDPQWYRKYENIIGTGPFKFTELVAGSHVAGKRNENYFIKGRPYLDGFRAINIPSDSTRVQAIRGGRAHVDFRYISAPQRDDLVNAMGDKVTVQENPMCSCSSFAINSKRKPFDDVRVRKALRLAMDQWKGAEVLPNIASAKWVGGLVRPGSQFAMSDAEITKLIGSGKDIEAARKEARRLLREAGVPEGFKVTIANDNSHEAVAIWLIDQWRMIGLNAEQVIREEGPHYDVIRKGDFDICMAPMADFMDDPSIQLGRHISADKTGANYGGYIDRVLDDLFEKQDRSTSPAERKKLVTQFEKRVLDEMAYFLPVPWNQRIVAHSAKMKGWKSLPSQYLNVDLTDVWLTED
jgi:peptide/nickel transport system substrate-binding protein